MLSNGKIAVHVRGPCLVRAGYGTSCRQIVDYLLSDPRFFVFLENVGWGGCPWTHREDFEDPTRLDRYYECMRAYEDAKRQNVPFDISVQCSVANEFERRAQINIGCTAGIEVDRCAYEWVKRCNQMELVVVPSEFSKKILSETVYQTKNNQTGQIQEEKITRPIHVIPHWFEHPAEPAASKLEFSTKKNLLFVGMWGNKGGFGEDRKNVSDLIRMFCAKFGDDADYGLVLKTSTITNSPQDLEETKKKIEHVKSHFKDLKAKIYLIHEYLTDKEMHSLYTHPSIIGMINVGHGEGFCGLDYTPILTESGYKRLDSVEIGERVLTHNRHYKKTTNLLSREHDGEMIRIRPFLAQTYEDIVLTPNHNVYVYNKGEGKSWKPAGEIRQNDLLLLPVPQQQKLYNSINLNDFIEDPNIVEDDDVLKFEHQNNTGKELKNKQKLDRNFGKLLGYYCAEGNSSPSKGTINFSFHIDEEFTLVEDLSNILWEKFKIKGAILKEDNTLVLNVYSGILSKFLSGFIGSTSKTKFINKFVLGAPEEFKEGFISTLFAGDGFLSKKNNKLDISLELNSENVVRNIRRILLEFGILGSLSKQHKTGIVKSKKGNGKFDNDYFRIRISDKNYKQKLLNIFNKNCSYINEQINFDYKVNGGGKTWCDDEYFYLKIKSLSTEHYKGKVYNISVEDDESYTTENFIVHNCLPMLEAASVGLPIIATNWSGYLDFCQPKRGFIPLEYDMVEIPDCQVWENIIEKGSRWAKVREEDFVKRVSKFLKSPKLIQDQAKLSVHWIKESFGKEAVMAQWKGFYDGFIRAKSNVQNLNLDSEEDRKIAEMMVHKERVEDEAEKIRKQYGIEPKSDKKKVLYVMPQSFGDSVISTAIVNSLIQTRHPEDEFYVATSKQYMEVYDALVKENGVKIIEVQEKLLQAELTREVWDYVYCPGINVQYVWSNWNLGNGEYGLQLLSEFAKNCNLHPQDIKDYKLAPAECWIPSKPFISITPVTSKQAKSYKYWDDIIANLKEMGDFDIVQLGAKDETLYSGCIDMRGKTYNETLYIVSKSFLHLAPDTGTAHVAGALKVPHVVLFASTSPNQCSPTIFDKSTKQVAIISKKSCDGCNCYKDVCALTKDGKNCLSNIEPETICQIVFDMIKSIEAGAEKNEKE